MFYLDTRRGTAARPSIFIDSEWALTAISQAQFWPDVNLGNAATAASTGCCRSMSRSGSGRASEPACAAKDCTKEADLRRGLGAARRPYRRRVSRHESNILSRSSSIPQFSSPIRATRTTNWNRCLSTLKNSWKDRPCSRDEDPQLLPRRRFRTAPTRTWRRWKPPTRLPAAP